MTPSCQRRDDLPPMTEREDGMELFVIPEQGLEQYIYKRQQPVLSAAFPKWAMHFEKHYLFVPCEPAVSVDYRPWWHPMPLGIKAFTTGFPPPPISYFELQGHAGTDKPDPKGRVPVRNGQVDLALLRKRVEQVRQKAARQIEVYRNQEKQTMPYTVALTPAEASHLDSRKERCSCGHMDAFHRDYESTVYCEVSGCQGCHEA